MSSRLVRQQNLKSARFAGIGFLKGKIRQRPGGGSRPLSPFEGTGKSDGMEPFRGEQQMLAIGRALMSRPEVSLSTSRRWGLRPSSLRSCLKKIVAINKPDDDSSREQNARLAMRVSHYTT
jgi:hypothetical protein